MASKRSVYLDDDVVYLINREAKKGESFSAVICRLIRQGSEYEVIHEVIVRRKNGS